MACGIPPEKPHARRPPAPDSLRVGQVLLGRAHAQHHLARQVGARHRHGRSLADRLLPPEQAVLPGPRQPVYFFSAAQHHRGANGQAAHLRSALLEGRKRVHRAGQQLRGRHRSPPQAVWNAGRAAIDSSQAFTWGEHEDSRLRFSRHVLLGVICKFATRSPVARWRVLRTPLRASSSALPSLLCAHCRSVLGGRRADSARITRVGARPAPPPFAGDAGAGHRAPGSDLVWEIVGVDIEFPG